MGKPLISSVHGSHSKPCFATTKLPQKPRKLDKKTKKHLYKNTPPDFSVSTPVFLILTPPPKKKHHTNTPYPSYPDIFNFHDILPRTLLHLRRIWSCILELYLVAFCSRHLAAGNYRKPRGGNSDNFVPPTEVVRNDPKLFLLWPPQT